MTVEGTINRTGILLLCVLATAAWTWSQFFTSRDPAVVGPYILIGALGGFVMAMITVFKKEWAGITAPIYALLEGLFLGAVSAMLELRFPGIAIQAVALTFGTCICLLLAYRSGLIRATEKFKLGIVAATGGIARPDTFRQRFADGAAMHGDKRKPAALLVQLMDTSRQDLLACPGFTLQENCNIAYIRGPPSTAQQVDHIW